MNEISETRLSMNLDQSSVDPLPTAYDKWTRMGTTQAAITPRGDYRLFNANAVALAAFICSPLGGAILIAVNYGRLGKAGKGALAILFGSMATALPILIQWNWKTPAGSLVSLALGFLFFLCTWQIAHEIHGEAIEEHIARGGKLGTKSTALFVGIASLAAVFGVMYAALFAIQDRKLIIGNKDVVVYSGLATKPSALALGNELRSDKYFLDHGATVLLDRGIGSRTLSFVVQDGIWNQPGMLSSFEELAREAAPAVGGLPVDVQLLDSKQEVEAKSTVGDACFGDNNCVYYEGSATRDEAKALGQQLESTGVFRGKDATVFLIRHDGEGTTLAFVIVGEAWTNPRKLSELETIVRDAAPAVGGLPIVMHLVNTQLELEKEELIE
jgi:hypothetical protein